MPGVAWRGSLSRRAIRRTGRRLLHADRGELQKGRPAGGARQAPAALSRTGSRHREAGRRSPQPGQRARRGPATRRDPSGPPRGRHHRRLCRRGRCAARARQRLLCTLRLHVLPVSAAAPVPAASDLRATRAVISPPRCRQIRHRRRTPRLRSRCPCERGRAPVPAPLTDRQYAPNVRACLARCRGPGGADTEPSHGLRLSVSCPDGCTFGSTSQPTTMATREGGHFEHELGDLCQLANDPWSIVPLVPRAEQAAPAPQPVVPTPTGVVDARPALAPSIRAPPVA